MFNKVYKILGLAALILVSSSCEEWLDIDPRQSITPELALEDISGYEGVLYAAYNANIGFGYYGQNQNIAPDILADNLVIANRTGRYIGESVNEVGAHMSRWGLYGTINLCNIVLDPAGLDALTLTTAEVATRDRIKGEAYFIRAMNYHDLLRSHSYEPGQEVNGWNEGVILRTTPTNGVSSADFRTRSTNEEGYMQVESDLLAAINLLPLEASTSDAPYRASKAAAQALLARVYLYWGKYSEAATMADNALAGTAKTLTTAADYEASFSASPHPESIFELEIRAADWSGVDGVNNSMASLATTGLFPNSQFVVAASDELLSSHEAGDIRRDLWVDRDASGRFQSNKWVGEKGDFLENIPVMKVPELLLIAAEAKARSSNEPGARTNLQTLRTARGLTATVTASGSGLLDLIMNERRVELALEGHRFYDLKRLGMDIPKPAINSESLVTYSDFRILARIPISQTQLNADLEQNPGY